jgi:tRNA(Ile2) C34 agmatinyltransferase TiaS
MSTLLWILVPVAPVMIFLRWAFFAHLRIQRAPFCPVCGESRGRFMGVGEQTGQVYFRCPHCGNAFKGTED